MLKLRFICDQCQTEIETWHSSKCLARAQKSPYTPELCFSVWDEERAKAAETHLCSDRCTINFIFAWIDEHELPELVPAPPENVAAEEASQ